MDAAAHGIHVTETSEQCLENIKNAFSHVEKGNGSSLASLSRVARLYRLYRLVRLLRMAKIFKLNNSGLAS
jgi:hypothetical protein